MNNTTRSQLLRRIINAADNDPTTMAAAEGRYLTGDAQHEAWIQHLDRMKRTPRAAEEVIAAARWYQEHVDYSDWEDLARAHHALDQQDEAIHCAIHLPHARRDMLLEAFLEAQIARGDWRGVEALVDHIDRELRPTEWEALLRAMLKEGRSLNFDSEYRKILLTPDAQRLLEQEHTRRVKVHGEFSDEALSIHQILAQPQFPPAPGIAWEMVRDNLRALHPDILISTSEFLNELNRVYFQTRDRKQLAAVTECWIHSGECRTDPGTLFILLNRKLNVEELVLVAEYLVRAWRDKAVIMLGTIDTITRDHALLNRLAVHREQQDILKAAYVASLLSPALAVMHLEELVILVPEGDKDETEICKLLGGILTAL